MYAVIFRARIAQLDEEYTAVATRMRALAMDEYGCVDFVSVMSGRDEISISYWANEADIQAWKADPEHLLAQEIGRSHWYESYDVQVTRVERAYSSGG